MARPKPQRVRRAFDRAAGGFGQADFLHSEIRRRMLEERSTTLQRARELAQELGGKR